MTTLISPSTEQLREQVDLLLHSPAFATSETLRKLLAFLASHAIEGNPDSLKVREIAVGVFGRAQDFDSQSDSVVRVHTGRLRSKLAEYYMEDGADDEVIIAIPKGGYALTSHFRHTSAPRALEPVAIGDLADANLQPLTHSVDIPARIVAVPKAVSLRVFFMSLLLVATAGWIASNYVSRRAERNRVPEVLRTFWQDFANTSDHSLLVFSNFRFLSSGSAGLLTYTGPEDPQKPIVDTYTTMGEVTGVYDVGRMLLLLGNAPEVKRGRLLTWDEAKDSNLIFVGGPLAETPLRDVPLLNDFEFKNDVPRDEKKVGAIYNKKPRAGEDSMYFASDSVYSNKDIHTSKIDYAIVALRPSFSANHRTLVLAGISEYGTQGASEFVTCEPCVRELLSKLSVRPGQQVPAFEALIRVRVEGGVPVESHLVLVHSGS